MKSLQLLFTSLALCVGLFVHAQCPITINFSSNQCNGSAGTIGFVSGFTDCPAADSISVAWQFSTGDTGVIPLLPTPSFQLPFTLMPGATSVCFFVILTDANDIVVGSTEQCFPISPNPLVITTQVVQSASGCGMADGCAYINITGGMPPYQYFLGGNNNPSPGNNFPLGLVCGLAPGPHYVIVTDALGCTFTQTFYIETGPSAGIAALVFNDFNGNGYMGSGMFSEPALGGMPFYLVEADVTVYTGADGYFYLPELPDGTYTLLFAGDTDVWSGPSEIVLTAPVCDSIPLQSSIPVYAQASGLSNWANILHCINGLNIGISVANTGNAAFSGTLIMNGPSSLSYTAMNNGQAFDTQNGGDLVWNITDQMPGSQTIYGTHINGPGTAFLGQNFPMTFTLVLYDGDGNVFYENTWTIAPVVTCAYDPNDKQAVPEGYAEPHFILQDTEIVYTVRFQNTGNAPAEDVRIDDLIDIAHLDLSSFEPVSASHDYFTEVNPDGMVKFHFNNIMLPDSTNDEPNSHGYVTYRISLRSDVEVGDEIYNSAAIYFDQNEPIITNETWHTIYTCAALNTDNSTLNACFGSFVILEDATEYVEDYSWTWNGEEISTTPEYVHYAMPVGSNELALTLSNPLCEVTTVREVIVHDEPEVSITLNDETLTATPGAANYEWFLNGFLIEGEDTNEIIVTVDGTYLVTYFDEFGCYGSADFVFVGINEVSLTAPLLFPNPLSASSQLELPVGVWTIRMFDSTGREVMNRMSVQGIQVFDATQFVSGYYLMKGLNDSGEFWTVPVLVK